MNLKNPIFLIFIKNHYFFQPKLTAIVTIAISPQIRSFDIQTDNDKTAKLTKIQRRKKIDNESAKENLSESAKKLVVRSIVCSSILPKTGWSHITYIKNYDILNGVTA
jgi:hypothetical protein